LLVHPQSNIGTPGEDRCVRIGGAQLGQLGQSLRSRKLGPVVLINERLVTLHRLQLVDDRRPVERHRRQVEHLFAGLQDRAVTGAPAQVTGERVAKLGFAWARPLSLVLEVDIPKRHHETGRTESALGAMAGHHRLLHRMQVAAVLAQVFDSEQRPPVERRYELNACVHRLHLQTIRLKLAHDHRAGAAIAFGAPLLGPATAQVFTQKIENRFGGLYVVDGDDFAIEHEADRVLRV
jgi:hypothetical protein